MVLNRTRGKIRRVRTGLGLIARVHRRQPHPLRLARAIWTVFTRRGLIGLRQWLINAALIEKPTHSISFASLTMPPPPPLPPAALSYKNWLDRYDPSGEEQRRAARGHLATLDLPGIVILVLISEEDLSSVAEMVVSWQASIHPSWQAAILIPPGLAAAGLEILQMAAARDNRISIVATAWEIDELRKQFPFSLLSFGPVVLNSLSLYMALEAATRTGAAAVYFDHDSMAADGSRIDPAFKPQFSPEYLASHNYIGDCLLISNVLAWTSDESLSLFGIDLSKFDHFVARLLLQASADGRLIEHLPFLLFHVSQSRQRLSRNLRVFAATGPSVSIIIPTRDGLSHLEPCINSIFERTLYDLEQVEIIVIDNDSVEPETAEYLSELSRRPRVTIVKYPAPFNFAEINNIGARAANGRVLVFLNNDTLVEDTAWLSKLVGYAQQQGVGIVGAKLLYPDGTIQHGGCVAGGSMGTVQHLNTFAQPNDIAAIDHTREMTLVTGACIAVRHDVFLKIGGFDPVLRVTWNDSKLCLAAVAAGFRNIYISDPLLIHDESKTRGHDNTISTYNRYFGEADYTRRRYRDYFHDDPSYNPNLSLEQAGEFAEPPRVRLPWFRQPGGPRRILLLSAVYKVGYGVPVVIQQHAKKLREKGYDVVIGGPNAENEMHFPGCERVVLDSAKAAAVYAFSSGISLVVAHTPPFFEVPILIGGHIPVLSYDYGEPASEFFEGVTRDYLLNVGYQKRSAAALTTKIAAISQSVKDETLNKDALVIGLANSHLPHWSEELRLARDQVRDVQGWRDCFIVLTVCRFHENERLYKGLDKIAAIMREFPYLWPTQSKPVVWVLAGAGTPTDVAQAKLLGFTVFPNISDAVLTDLYKAADAYMGFSKWEGYNLGISQALAMGLPTLGSDIPAHREFGIVTTNSVLKACDWLAKAVEQHAAAKPEARVAEIYDWDRKAAAFEEVICNMLQHSAVQKARAGASGLTWEAPVFPGSSGAL